MRRLATFSLVIALVGCSGDGSRSDPPTTTTAAATSTTAEPVARTTTAPVPSSTSTTTTGDETGDEAISVTEKITITITDPEDG